jgi:hypothetical protein
MLTGTAKACLPLSRTRLVTRAIDLHTSLFLTKLSQGQCGACWAFSTAEEIESEWKFQGNYIWEFSPQQVASCTTTCNGCGGGNQILGYEYLMVSSTIEAYLCMMIT